MWKNGKEPSIWCHPPESFAWRKGEKCQTEADTPILAECAGKFAETFGREYLSGMESSRASDEGAAAIHGEDPAGNEVLSGEEEDGSGDIVARAGTMERGALDVVGVGKLTGKLNGAGSDAVDEDFGSESAGQAAGEHD